MDTSTKRQHLHSERKRVLISYIYQKTIMKKIFFCCLSLLLILSCSKDNDVPTDPVTSISMKINGVERAFEASGRGINLNADGSHTLDLQFYSYATTEAENMRIVMKYKKKGNNVIDVFSMTSNPNGLSANATGNTFTNKVTVNSRKQFTATFSGTMQNDTETVTITEGYVNYIYEQPFD
jgi:hypothetical protein